MTGCYLHDSGVLPYSREFLYSVLIDVEKYPKILRYIHKVALYPRGSGDLLRARVVLGGYRLYFTYDCLIRGLCPERIEVESIDEEMQSDFRLVYGLWVLKALEPNQSLVEYTLQFELKSAVKQKLAYSLVKHRRDSTIAQLKKYLQEKGV